MILANTSAVKSCSGRMLCGLLRAYMCVLCVFSISSREKVASSQNNTELEKCMAATLWITNTTRCGRSSGCIIALSILETYVRLQSAVDDAQLFEIFWLQRQAPVHWYRDFGPQHATHPLKIWVYILF
ncbi:hypothetical protein TNCT_7051 [Trichonephila clavata]|uniref:Uncharacterized protein n=1 Tax=Trichonephila clavata TaxID=2740835 RepID=A0A8X6HGX9_TRICU|nr:hypothetical protein TNCT_7051 [Trichonephila clavata]